MIRASRTDWPTSSIAPPQGEDERSAAHRTEPDSHRAGQSIGIADRGASDLGDHLAAAVAQPIRRPADRAGRAMHGIGALAGSLAVHSVAVAAMYYLVAAKHSDWILPLHRGKDSVQLAASIAAPPPSSDEPITIERPEPVPPSPREPRPIDSEPLPPPVKQSTSPPAQPPVSFAELSAARRQPPPPVPEVRPEIDLTQRNEDRLEVQPKPTPRARPQAAPRELAASTTMESVAASASAADSGVVTEQPPAVVHVVEPIYPAESLTAREQGIVKLRIKVDSSGQVVAASLYRTSGFPRLDQAALDVIHQHRFAPADDRTTGRAAEFVWPITFRLKIQPVRR